MVLLQRRNGGAQFDGILPKHCESWATTLFKDDTHNVAVQKHFKENWEVRCSNTCVTNNMSSYAEEKFR